MHGTPGFNGGLHRTAAAGIYIRQLNEIECRLGAQGLQLVALQAQYLALARTAQTSAEAVKKLESELAAQNSQIQQLQYQIQILKTNDVVIEAKARQAQITAKKAALYAKHAQEMAKANKRCCS